MGSCPEPPPDTTPTFPSTGASARTTNGGSYETRTRSPYASSTPSSDSRRTASGALMSFFIAMVGLREERLERERAQRAAHERPDHRNPRVAPIGRALARDRQDRVDDPRPEISRGIDRVPGRSAQRQADREHEQPDDERGERTHRMSPDVRAERQDHEHEHEGADDLRDDVRDGVADRRRRREHGQLQPGILGWSPVV